MPVLAVIEPAHQAVATWIALLQNWPQRNAVHAGAHPKSRRKDSAGRQHHRNLGENQRQRRPPRHRSTTGDGRRASRTRRRQETRPHHRQRRLQRTIGYLTWGRPLACSNHSQSTYKNSLAFKIAKQASTSAAAA